MSLEANHIFISRHSKCLVWVLQTMSCDKRVDIKNKSYSYELFTVFSTVLCKKMEHKSVAFTCSSYGQWRWMVPVVRVDRVHSDLWDRNSTEGPFLRRNQQSLHGTFYPDPQVQSGQMRQPWWGFVLSSFFNASSWLTQFLFELWHPVVTVAPILSQPQYAPLAVI